MPGVVERVFASDLHLPGAAPGVRGVQGGLGAVCCVQGTLQPGHDSPQVPCLSFCSTQSNFLLGKGATFLDIACALHQSPFLLKL